LETGNDVDLEAIASKYKHFNNYEFSGPETPGFFYPASGTTDDWAYGTLGAAGMTFEVGNAFYQDCQYFEDSILDGNIKALTYAAKTSKAPYSLSKGPDVTAVIARMVDGNTLAVTATASDSAWSSSSHPASNQGIREIRVYVNEHPFDSLRGQTGFVQAGESVDIDVSTLAEGRHFIYVQAEDEDGYKGLVTAAYFVKEGSPGPFQTSNPVAPPVDTFVPIPVASPTTAPVASPTAAPIASPVSVPISGRVSESPISGPVSPPAEVCTDSLSVFYVFVLGTFQGCDWLAVNMNRFSFLCQVSTSVSIACPLTCGRCG
jgi:hypothetical protein